MIHFSPLDPSSPPAVSENLAAGRLTVDLTSIGGEIHEFELSVLEAERFATRLRDAASAVRVFAQTHQGGTAAARRVREQFS